MTKFKKTISDVLNFLREIYNDIDYLNWIKKNNYEANFIYDGGKKISLPKYTSKTWALLEIKKFRRLRVFSNRTNKEVLLRKITYQLFTNKYLDTNKSIIDVGCWLADNTLPWSRMLDGSGVVFAIDPSAENLKFGQFLADLNDISNIEWVEGVCSEKINQNLKYFGNINHAKFFEVEVAKEVIKSTTLDEIVYGSNFQDISLIHVDVEGLEANVLKGAKKIIDKCRPIIIFEYHLSDNSISEIFEWLEGQNYLVWMINEILPGCQLDCRNFVAWDANLPLPQQLVSDDWDDWSVGVHRATIGGPLVPMNKETQIQCDELKGS